MKWILVRPNGLDVHLLEDVFVKQLYRVHPTQVRTILDLGANIGATVVYLSCLFPDAQTACVEPVPENIHLLRKTVAMNGLKSAIFECAVGPADGSTVFYLDADPTAGSVVPLDSSITSQTVVAQISIPTLMARMGWERIDLLKVDIEGYEKVLLTDNAGWLRTVRTIVGEVHGHVGWNIEDVRSALTPYGFSVEEGRRDMSSATVIFSAVRNGDRVAMQLAG